MAKLLGTLHPWVLMPVQPLYPTIQTPYSIILKYMTLYPLHSYLSKMLLGFFGGTVSDLQENYGDNTKSFHILIAYGQLLLPLVLSTSLISKVNYISMKFFYPCIEVASFIYKVLFIF